jgi:hypothetical protein
MRFSITLNLAIEVTGSNLLSRVSWHRRRLQVRNRDNATCNYCGEPAPDGCADHIIPLSKGGTDNLDNLVWSCRVCNEAKGNKTLEEWQKEQRESHNENLDAQQAPLSVVEQVAPLVHDLKGQGKSQREIERQIFGYSGGSAHSVIKQALNRLEESPGTELQE